MSIWSIAGLARLDSPKITFSPLQTAAKVTTICSTPALRFVRLKRDKHCAFFLNSRFFFEHSVVAGAWEWVSGSVMALFLLATLFTDRPFCNYFCVKGASLGVWSILRPIGITREEKSCVHCSKCDQICPMNIEVDKTAFVRHPNCINCMQCLTACPKGCIKFKLIHSKR